MAVDTTSPHRPIATMGEGPLHASLKSWYARSGDRIEVPLAGRQIDIVRGDLLIEIQTKSMSSLRKKLDSLVDEHQIRVVYPVPLERWIVRVDDDGEQLGRRKSPKRGRIEDAFEEMVSLRGLLAHPHFSLELLLTQEDEVRRHQPGRSWRRKGWVIVERRLVDVLDRRLFQTPNDLLALLPPGLPVPFTTADVAAAADIPRALAQKMSYCLRQAGVVEDVGKRGHARAHRVAENR